MKGWERNELKERLGDAVRWAWESMGKKPSSGVYIASERAMLEDAADAALRSILAADRQSAAMYYQEHGHLLDGYTREDF